MLIYNKGGIMVKKGLYLSLIAFLLVSVVGFAGCRRIRPIKKRNSWWIMFPKPWI